MMYKNYDVSLLARFILVSVISSSCWHNNSKLVIQHHFNSLIKHDLKKLVADYDPNVQVTSSGWEGIHNGTAEVDKTWSHYFQTTPNLRFDIGNVYFSSDSVAVVEFTQSGSLTNPGPDIPAYMIGKKYMLNSCTIFTIKNNKIIKENTYFDQLSLLRQVGFFDHQQK